MGVFAIQGLGMGIGMVEDVGSDASGEAGRCGSRVSVTLHVVVVENVDVVEGVGPEGVQRRRVCVWMW